jgi:hypothetical protein
MVHILIKFNILFYVTYKAFKIINTFGRGLKAELSSLHWRKVGISDGEKLK